MEIRPILYALCFLIIFMFLIDNIGTKYIPSNMTRQTPHGPVFSKCALYGGRFYGFGGKCGEPLSWADVLIGGCLFIFIYRVLYK